MENKEVQWRDVRIFIDGKEVEGVTFEYPVVIGPADKVYPLRQKPTEDYFPEIWVNSLAKKMKKPANQ